LIITLPSFTMRGHMNVKQTFAAYNLHFCHGNNFQNNLLETEAVVAHVSDCGPHADPLCLQRTVLTKPRK
jgi:hypothetical protein